MFSGNKENELTRLNSQNKQQNVSVNNNSKNNNENCCCLCRAVKWYWEPLFPRLGYSLRVSFFQVFNYAIALGALIVTAVGVGVSVGLMIICVGFVLFYIISEILLLVARFDLWISYKMVEDNENVIKRSQRLQISLVNEMPRSSVDHSVQNKVNNSHYNNNGNDDNSNNINYNNMTFCMILRKRVKTLFTSCQMYMIILYFLIIKPIITLITCWTVLLIVYALYILVSAVWYFVDDHLFISGNICPLGYSMCKGNVCHCHGLHMDTTGNAVLVFFIGVFALPLAFRINNYSAQLSKSVTYYCLTQYYKFGLGDESENRELLYENDV